MWACIALAHLCHRFSSFDGRWGTAEPVNACHATKTLAGFEWEFCQWSFQKKRGVALRTWTLNKPKQHNFVEIEVLRFPMENIQNLQSSEMSITITPFTKNLEEEDKHVKCQAYLVSTPPAHPGASTKLVDVFPELPFPTGDASSEATIDFQG